MLKISLCSWGKGDQNNLKYAYVIYEWPLSERTAACLETYFPNSKSKQALAKFIRVVSDAHKICTSRVMLDKSDKLHSAFGMFYEVKRKHS